MSKGGDVTKIDIQSFSGQYIVRRVEKKDLPDVYALCSKNSLYYKYCPPTVTEQSIIDDMNALPTNKSIHDKYYLGYFDSDKLIAVMDLIMAYPDEKTAFIGFFMTDISVQNCGIGSKIIDELCSYLKTLALSGVQLGWVKENPQAEHFWHKNKFKETGISYDTDNYTVIVGHRVL